MQVETETIAQEHVRAILQASYLRAPTKAQGVAFAPANIALVKYWGKRCESLNLPQTSSLSISLQELGAKTHVERSLESTDEVYVNDKVAATTSNFYKNIVTFLNLLRPTIDFKFKVITRINIPISAGLASSAAGFAALTLALNDFFGWNLSLTQLSMLARMGSGSAARSVYHGFVKWHQGRQNDAMDCYAEQLNAVWPQLLVGLEIVDATAKAASSRDAMRQCVATNKLYQAWPQLVAQDLLDIEQAIIAQDFTRFGQIAEYNAQAMHALICSTRPSINYSSIKTQQVIAKVHALRARNVAVYYTQDAGPNIKLLFEINSLNSVKEAFPNLLLVSPFG